MVLGLQEHRKVTWFGNGFPKAADESTVLGNTNPDWRGGLGSRIKVENNNELQFFLF